MTIGFVLVIIYLKKNILLSKDAIDRKVTVKTLKMLQNIYFSNKCLNLQLIKQS